MGQVESKQINEVRQKFLSDHSISESEANNFVGWDHNAYKRLDSLIGCYEDKYCPPLFDDEFNQFVERNPKWLHESSVLFWKTHETGDKKIIEQRGRSFKVLRRQEPRGLCFMHAPVVLQHYLVSIGSGIAAEMLDVVQYINTHWTGKVLLNYLSSLGGNSVHFLQAIYNEDIVTSSYSITDRHDDEETHVAMCRSVMNKLQSKPALASQFNVFSKFFESSSTKQSVFTAVDKGENLILWF